MELEDKYELLSKCEDELICFVCEEWCKRPVKLSKCGHYFCANCLSSNEKACPKCKESFFDEDISRHSHCYDELKQNIMFLKTSLEALKTFLENRVENLKNVENLVHDYPFRISFIESIVQKDRRKNFKGETKLHLACKRRNLDEVKKLIEQKVDINAKDFANWTPLHEAIRAQSVEIVKELLANGALIDSPGEFYVTPLHKAVLMENPTLIKVLVEYGANKNALDFHGRKPEDYTDRQDLLNVLNSSKVKENIEKPHIFLKNQVVAYAHTIDEGFKKKISGLKNLRVLDKFDITKGEITHLLLKKSHKISTKILLCMLKGVIIVAQEWIDDFRDGKMNLPSHPVMENPTISAGIEKALINHLMNRPKLFDGLKFYVESAADKVVVHSLVLKRDFLQLLISTGGGVNLKRAPAPEMAEVQKYPFHSTSESSIFGCCNIIIFNESNPPKLQYNMQEIRHKTCKWLIDCVINFKLI